MHSRIIQLSKEPIEKEDYIIEEDFFGYDICDSGFVGTVADYVSEDTDTEEDIDWFTSSFEEFGLEYDKAKNTLTFKKGFVDKYFESKFEEFKKLSASLTQEDFKSQLGMERYKIEQLLEDKFGFYVYTEFNSSLDRFVRNELQESDRDHTFYIGNTIDYHF